MKTFHHFHMGVSIEDWQINQWIEDCLAKIQGDHTHYSISSGDTSVIALKWDTSIEVIVANSAGKSRICFNTGEDKIEFEPYVRPVTTNLIK